MLVRRIVHTLCGVVLLGVLATSATGAMMDIAERRTSRSAARAAARRDLPAGTYIFEVANPDGGSDIVRVLSRDRKTVHLLQFTRSIYRASKGDLKAIHLPRRNSCWHPSTCESVVSAIRDPRPRVHLLTITPLPPPCLTFMRPARRASLLNALSLQLSAIRLSLNRKASDKTAEHPLDLSGVGFDLGCFGFFQQAEIGDEDRKIFEFTRGPQ